jgi:hypothetical protein
VLVCGDSLAWMRDQRERAYRCAVFSPPYSVSPSLFDARVDFQVGGRFIHYALELSRTCDLWAVNFSPLVDAGRCLPFLESLVVVLESCGVQLWDRWVMLKGSWRPYRGERALSNFEFVLLFTQYPNLIKIRPPVGTTAFQQEALERHQHEVQRWKRARGVDTIKLTSTPYAGSIPRHVLAMYGDRERPVLDPFCGSGTTLRVAQEMGMQYVGVDIDPLNIELCRALGLE